MNPAYSSCITPCPRASWDEKDFKDRCAFIRALKDRCIPYDIQNMMIKATEQRWILRDVDSGRNPQLSQPEKLTEVIVKLVKHFEGV